MNTIATPGYALATGFGIDDYWFTVFLASSIKWVILRQGGARTYRQSLPFFFGLIVGIISSHAAGLCSVLS